MPLINVYTSAPAPSADKRTTLLQSLSRTLAQELAKPEAYVMTCLVPQTSMTFAGTEAPACYAEIKNIGQLAPEKTTRLSNVLSALLERELGVPKNRIYLEFTNVEPHLFGFNGETFA
jgi:phenylpyruvate tautomerase PptA (4-oxalocrotonate tautomerase family)